ncbi:ATP-binding protein [Streptomyces sp. A 4/2]|uniref:ATP-binding protein n=1 Tax=Streptomyces sp. A 4/2 TaxID=2934314 RepID=UPI002025B493|nr:ATP-binding protein [Streptomyces sp. A 4/2]
MLGPSTALQENQECSLGRPLTHAVLDLRGLDAPQSAARGIVRRALTRAPAEFMDDVVLVADELVGNAVTHAGEAVDVSLDLYPWGMVVQVRDRDRDTAAVPRESAPAGDEDVNGRGLFLVNELASAWRVQSDEAGKRVVAVFLYRAGGMH